MLCYISKAQQWVVKRKTWRCRCRNPPIFNFVSNHPATSAFFSFQRGADIGVTRVASMAPTWDSSSTGMREVWEENFVGSCRKPKRRPLRPELRPEGIWLKG